MNISIVILVALISSSDLTPDDEQQCKVICDEDNICFKCCPIEDGIRCVRVEDD